MGKVNQLWQDEREKKFNDLFNRFVQDGYTEDEAEEMALNEMEAEDATNGQFGVGA